VLDEEHDNLRAALDWAAEDDRVEAGLRLSAALARFWEIRGYLAQGRARLHVFVSGSGGPPELRAKALNAAAVLAQRQGDVAGARASYQEALIVQRARGDRLGVATALHGLANLAVGDGDLITASALFEENLAIAREAGIGRMEAASLMNLGVVAHSAFMRGSRPVDDAGPDALRFYGESLAAYEKLGDRYGQALALENLGALTRLYPGDPVQARALHERCLVLRRGLGDRLGIADSARYIAALALWTGEVATARELHAERLAIGRELGNLAHVAEALTDLGEIGLVEGRLADARASLAEALAIYDASDDRESRLRVLTDLGELARKEGEYRECRSTLDRCMRLAEELDSRPAVAWALTQRARLARAEGDAAGVLTAARQALVIAEEYRLSGVEAVVLDLAGGIAADRGDLATAVRLAAAAQALRGSWFRPLEAEGRIDPDVAMVALGRAGYESARHEGASLTAEARRALVRGLAVD
jgi:tetratricopeptide (TPR) repeat protein